MNATHTLMERMASVMRVLFFAGLTAWMLGVPLVSRASVPVDQSPLVIEQPLPANLVLMLDDSGSMNSDYMPDLGYIQDTSYDGMRYHGNNGTYYNPNVNYNPPPTATGGTYPQSPGLAHAFRDGFLDQTVADEVDVTQFTGSYPYFHTFTSTQTSNYAPTLGCASGDSLVTDSSSPYYGECAHVESITYSYYNPSGGQANPTCNTGDTLVPKQNGSGYVCQHANITYSYSAPNTPTCPLGGSYDSTSNECVITGTTTVSLFTYTTPNSAGGYIHHYVGKTQQACSIALSQDASATCDYSLSTRLNVANWFSYYRTRIEMTKSGVMYAFTLLGSKFRVGFGSINGTNNGDLPSPWPSPDGTTMIAQVRAFGDGSSGTQKAALWEWVAGIRPNNTTPLRQALNAVGQYYETDPPWQTSSTDLTELACRQSYTILTTDGFWNGPSPNVGAVDDTNGSKMTGPNGLTYTYTAAPPYADGYTDTLADVAMKYWKNDLLTSVSNEVSPNPDDPAFWQHMTTFTLGLGLKPVNISPAGTTVSQIFDWANGGAPISGFSWPDPGMGNTVNTVADLAHAAVDGHGNFYSATSSQAFTSGLEAALLRAAARIGTGASLAANSTELKTGTVAYQANYYTVKWKGDLKAIAVDPNTGALSPTPTWQAAKEIPAYSSRNVWTYNPASQQYVRFNASNLPNLSTAEQSALGLNATDQQNVINYLLGDSSMEQRHNGIYRNRDTVLGDIVDSQPVYVGAPDPNQFYGEAFTGTTAYAQFASTYASRQALVYVAANDGMLHAFDANTGSEVYAFLPAAVITSGLASLSDPLYGTSAAPHQFFNDGELTVADVYMNSAWHTVLVGTTGRGLAETIYALDITNPANISLLWERSASDGKTNSGYIGQMNGKPVIAQTLDGTWSVLIGNGYNSVNGVATLLQFDLPTGSLSVHTTSDTNTSNGMAAPVLWIDDPSNGVSSMAYAGDLDGNVWSFALQNSSGNSATPSSYGTLLFTAKDSSGNIQSITGGMLAGMDPSTNNIWLFFGTGRYLSSNDLLDTSTQTWYGIIVKSTDSTLITNLLANGRASLKQRYILAQTTGNPNSNPPILPARAITPTPTPSDMTGMSGWFIDLLTPTVTSTSTTYTAQGERMVTPNQFQANLLLGTSRIPESTDLCDPSGTGWVMAVDPFTGTNPVQPFFDVNNDGLISAGDSITVGGKTFAAAGVGFSSLPNNPIFVGGSMLISFDNGTTGSIQTSGSTSGFGRVSWRELTTQ